MFFIFIFIAAMLSGGQVNVNTVDASNVQHIGCVVVVGTVESSLICPDGFTERS